MIRLRSYWMGRDQKYSDELTLAVHGNAERLLACVNELLAVLGLPDPDVRSGWRPQAVNDETANAAHSSKHLTGEAIDLADSKRKLALAVMTEPEVLTQCGLWMEDTRWTPTWVHLQCVPPASGQRIYIPSSSPALAPPVLV